MEELVELGVVEAVLLELGVVVEKLESELLDEVELELGVVEAVIELGELLVEP